MTKFFFCNTEKLLEILVEKALPMLVEYLITELVKESINQAQKHRKTKHGIKI